MPHVIDSLVELSGIEPLTSSLRKCYVTHFNDLEQHLRAQNAGKQPVETLIVSLLRPYCAHADPLINAAWTVPSVAQIWSIRFYRVDVHISSF